MPQGLLQTTISEGTNSRKGALTLARKRRGVCEQQLVPHLFVLRVDARTSCDEVKQRTEAKIAEVERKMVDLQRMRQALLQVASLCTGPGPTSACPMLDALDQQELLDPAE
jgi:hypothetical protein